MNKKIMYTENLIFTITTDLSIIELVKEATKDLGSVITNMFFDNYSSALKHPKFDRAHLFIASTDFRSFDNQELVSILAEMVRVVPTLYIVQSKIIQSDWIYIKNKFKKDHFFNFIESPCPQKLEHNIKLMLSLSGICSMYSVDVAKENYTEDELRSMWKSMIIRDRNILAGMKLADQMKEQMNKQIKDIQSNVVGEIDADPSCSDE